MNTIASGTAACGWHGKLPTLGDFAERRLPPEFIEPWDAWLSDGLERLREQPGWLDAYLASPSWRFLLMPDALAPAADAWVGVLMPSVDRVGRYYPLTLAHRIDALPADGAQVDILWSWLLAVDEAAADALQDDWSIEQLEAELQRLGPPPHGDIRIDARLPMTSTHDGPLQRLPLARHRHAGAMLASQASGLWLDAMRGRAFWYADSGLPEPCLLCSTAPDAGLAARLLGMKADNADAAP